MSEEELEAIEELKKFSNLIIEGGIPNSLIVNKLKITFNLIDKLQKENEKLKELVGFTTIRIKTDDIKMLTKDFISKDKIRAKTKELSKTQAYKVGLEEYTIKILEELLEDN